MGTRGTVGGMGLSIGEWMNREDDPPSPPKLKRWDDRSISWDARRRVAERAQDAFASIKDVPPWSRLDIYEQADSITAAVAAFKSGAGYASPWKKCVASALRAEGFEVPGE